MKAEFTAIIEPAPEGGYWAICPEVPGANGQGETIEDAKDSLRKAIELVLEDRKADILRGLPDDAIQDTVLIGRDLERRLRIAGCYLKREGSSHSLWINPKTGVTEAVPRHADIKEPLARKILKSLRAE